MIKEWIEDHILIALLLLSVMGVAIGFLGTYVVAGLIAIWHITEFIFVTSQVVGVT